MIASAGETGDQGGDKPVRIRSSLLGSFPEGGGRYTLYTIHYIPYYTLYSI